MWCRISVFSMRACWMKSKVCAKFRLGGGRGGFSKNGTEFSFWNFTWVFGWSFNNTRISVGTNWEDQYIIEYCINTNTQISGVFGFVNFFFLHVSYSNCYSFLTWVYKIGLGIFNKIDNPFINIWYKDCLFIPGLCELRKMIYMFIYACGSWNTASLLCASPISNAISSISQSQMSLLFMGSDMYVWYYSHYSNHWNAPCYGLPDQLYKLAIKQPLFKCVTCMLNFWPAMSFHGIWPKSTGYRALAKVVCVIKPCVNRRTSLHHFCNPATLTPS